MSHEARLRAAIVKMHHESDDGIPAGGLAHESCDAFPLFLLATYEHVYRFQNFVFKDHPAQMPRARMNATVADK